MDDDDEDEDPGEEPNEEDATALFVQINYCRGEATRQNMHKVAEHLRAASAAMLEALGIDPALNLGQDEVPTRQ